MGDKVQMENMQKYLLAILVDNKPGVLTHVSGLISRRAFNIESISAGYTEEPEVTRINIVVSVESDRELLSLVWNNLFSNAIKFTEEGGKVGLKLYKDTGHAVVEVSDTGCGISPEVGAHIFEKFYQGDTSHATQGNGLGLALVKRVVDIVGGEIGVSSDLGKGTTFTVKIKAV